MGDMQAHRDLTTYNSAMENIVIIGSGPAGLTASIYLARSGLCPVVIAGEKPGGQLINTDIIENYPGFESINGAELMMRTLSQAEKLGVRIIYESVKTISKENGCFRVSLFSDELIDSRSVLIATGAKHRHLGIPGEKEFANKGVSWCATCDGPIYRDKDVAVVGGGNTAVMETLFLSNIARKVYLIHRKDSLRAEKLMQERLFSLKNIEFIWNSEVLEVFGETSVHSLKLNNGRVLDVSALFIAIGTVPSSDIVKGMVSLDNEGYIIARDTQTEMPGMFAAGDIVSGSAKQAIFAAGQGCLASQYIGKYLGLR